MTRLVPACVVLCFFVSGLGSLILEVVWTRMLRLVFGSTTLAVSTILVSYMLGLGLGGLLGGRMAGAIQRRWGRGVALYGILEIGIAAYALAVPTLLDALPPLQRAFVYELSFWPAALFRFVLAVGALAVPTLLMGATLPLIVATLLRESKATGRRIALLYGVNTLGAVGGVLLATFVLFGAFGLEGANRIGAGLDAVAGAIALAFLARHFPARTPTPEAVPVEIAPVGRRRWGAPVIAYGLVGFTALVYEVAWTRTLAMVLGSSIYAFAAMLSSFLAGIALGSVLARSWVDRFTRPLVVFSGGIVVLGLCSLGSLYVLPLMPRVFALTVARFGYTSGVLVPVHFAACVSVMLPATLVLGALFPLLARTLAPTADAAGEAVGRVYFTNTLGAAIGAFLAGFVLVPALGAYATIALAVAVNLATGAFLIASHPGPRLARVALPAVLAVTSVWLIASPPAWDRLLLARGVFLPQYARELVTDVFIPEGIPREKLVFYEDGLNATASVHEFLERSSLHINGKPDASSIDDMPTQVLSGHIPLLFGAPAKDVLVIGLASGVTVGSAARHDVDRITVVELEPAVVRASRFFDPQSGAPLDDPRVELVVDDGRAYVSYGPGRFDVIISEPSNPWMTGASALFTREHLLAARAALHPGGRLLQWVQLYGMDREGLASLLATLRSVFPNVYGFRYERGYPDLLLLASEQPLLPAHLPRWDLLNDAVRADLERVGLFSSEDVWSLLRLAPDDVDALTGADPTLNLDSNLFIELRTPWAFYETTLPEHWERIDATTAGLVALLQRLFGESPDDAGALACSTIERRRDPPAAEAWLQAVPSSAVAAACRAQLTGESADLIAAAERAPGSFWPLLLRSELRRHDGETAGAIADAAAAERSRPGDLRAQIALARALAADGREQQAAAVYERILATPYAKSERGFRLLHEVVRLYLFGGQLDSGIAHLERLLAREPFDPAAWKLLGEAYAASGREADSDRARRNAARLEARAFTGAAERLAKEGRRQQAVELLERATALDPQFERARDDLDALRR